MKITNRHSISGARKNGNSVHGMSPTWQLSCILKGAVFRAPNTGQEESFLAWLADSLGLTTRKAGLMPTSHRGSRSQLLLESTFHVFGEMCGNYLRPAAPRQRPMQWVWCSGMSPNQVSSAGRADSLVVTQEK